MPERNLMLPCNLRYQPKVLVPIFGYDNLYRPVIEVELAGMDVLAEIGVIPAGDYALLTPKIREATLEITTTQVDKIEREGEGDKKATKHDIRALVWCMQQRLPLPLRRWVHVPFTSYDPLDTGRALQFVRAHLALHPMVREVEHALADLVHDTAGIPQIGRTHGQHALPITVGFWLATILGRIIYCRRRMEEFQKGLVGKISGAVGAKNAQVALGIEDRCGSTNFESRVLKKLGLAPAPISTQILSPEPLAFYLFSALNMSAAIAQFGRDCRNLMRTEIAEIQEGFEAGQVGSSTMAHKRNPISFENMEGMYTRTKNEFGKVLDTMISEHQRDLVGSCVARDFPLVMINLAQQLSGLVRKNGAGQSFLARIQVNQEALRRNLEMQGHLVLAEPLYIALQMAGYEGDAHELVNHQAMPISVAEHIPLLHAVERLAEEDERIASALERVPSDVKTLLLDPPSYVGSAQAQALQIADLAGA